MTVAILMPAHNRADVIGDAILSCQMQKDPKWELTIWVDGGDLTETLKQVDEFDDDRVWPRMANWKNPANEPGVRNELLDGWAWTDKSGWPFAPCEYACWLDSDDLMAPERIAVQRAYLDAHPDVDLVFSDMAVFRDSPEHIEEIRSVDPSHFGKSLDGYRTLVSPTAMFRPSVRAVRFDERMIHGGCDKLWLFTLIQQGFKVATIRQPLYYLREHPGRLTRQREQMPKEALKADLDHFYAEVERMGGTR